MFVKILLLVLFFALMLVPIVRLFTRKMDKTLVDEIYVCYNKMVNVPAKDVLEDE